MKNSGFIIFFAIVLTIYFVLNCYIFSRGLQALPKEGSLRTIYSIVLLILILAYPAGRILERFANSDVLNFLIHLGAYYLAMMVFAFFIILFIDLLRVGNWFFHYFPSPISQNLNLAVFTSVVGITLILTLAGAWNARHIRIRELDIDLTKHSRSADELNIVLASDIHLGTIIHNSRLEEIVAKINALNPDVILLAGDVFDEDISSLVEQNTAAILARLKSKYGVYAIPGNHEYFSGINAAIDYLHQANITVLRDSVALVADSFYLVGRDDRTGVRFRSDRTPLSALLHNVPQDYPIILMDHQPFQLEDAQKNGVDLQVSGHTHHGQLFPFNFITKKVYELSWGYLKKGNTHYYVSCGVGTWGPPVRLGNRPEIVKITIKLQ